MKRLFAVLFLVFATVSAFAQAPVIQAHLQPSRNILVGQPVRLVVTVYVPNYFTGEPDFADFELENAIVVLPQDRPANSNTEINGVRYAGITETYVIYPQQPGDFHLPPMQISVPYASAPPKSITAQVKLPSLYFHADVPSDAKGMEDFLPTTSLKLQQKWSSSFKNLRVGDSIDRSITVTSAHMQAMLIPPLPFDAPAGIRVYPQKTVVQNQKTSRGEFIYGFRAQSATYLIQKAGDYTLPAIDLKWWNLSTNRVVTATLPSVHFIAAPNPDYVTELPPELETTPVAPVKHISFWKRYRSRILLIAVYTVAALILLWLGLHYLPRIFQVFREWRERKKHSEAEYFRQLQRACRHNDATEAYRWLLKWTASAYPNLTLEHILKRSADPALASEVNGLGVVVFESRKEQQSWHGKKLAQLLKFQRDKYLRRSARRQGLASLNPEGFTE